MNVYFVTFVRIGEDNVEKHRRVKVGADDVEEALARSQKLSKEGERVLEVQKKFALDG